MAYGPPRRPLAERLWAKTAKAEGDACWLWTGARMTSGYGHICVGGRSGPLIGAHQAAWIVTNGPIENGLFVLHRCDTRLCVRPSHLFLGTAGDNIRDCVAKNRHFSPQRLKTTCPHGHAYSAENTFISNRRNGTRARYCIACMKTWKPDPVKAREATRRYRARQRLRATAGGNSPTNLS